MTALGSLYHSNLLELLSNPTKSIHLQMELAIIVHVGNVFLIFLRQHRIFKEMDPQYCQHMNISFLFSIATTVHYPNTAAICYLITSIEAL